MKLNLNGGGETNMVNKKGDGKNTKGGGGFKDGKLRILYTNIESVHNKINELELRIAEFVPDLICITESWERVGKPEKDVTLTGYRKLSKPTNDRRGGLIIFVKEKFCVEECSELTNHSFVESLWCWVTVGSSRVLVGVIYRKQSLGYYNNNRLNDLMRQSCGMNIRNVLIMGDFNYPTINWNTMSVPGGVARAPFEFLDTVNDCLVVQHVKNFTRVRGENQPSTLDLLFTNSEHDIDNLEYDSPIGLSDHCVLKFEYDVGSQFCSATNKPQLNFFKSKLENIRSDLHRDWTSEMTDLDVDESWGLFKSYYDNTVSRNVPVRPAKVNKDKPLWLNNTTIKSSRRKNLAYKRYCKCPNRARYKEYEKERRKCKNIIRSQKIDFERKLVEDMKVNTRAFYKYAGRKTKTKATITNVKRKDGTLTETTAETAEELKKFFASVYQRESDEDILIASSFGQLVGEDRVEVLNYKGVLSENIIEEISVGRFEIENLLRGANEYKAVGPDNVHPFILKSLACELSIPFEIIFNKSLRTGRLPRAWKEAVITPIHKKGKKNEVTNYRPISLTSQVCKILEKIIRDRIVNHLEMNKLITEHQHGFMHGRSCLTNLLECLEDWTKSYDEGMQTDVIYLDFRKAFDTVPVQRLVFKLEKLGVRGRLLTWVEDFLTNRKSCCSVGGERSSWFDVGSGVPQGTVLGPILFLVYINDLPENICSKIKLFADDAKLYRKMNDMEDDHNILQKDLNSYCGWNEEWLLQPSKEKCEVLHVGNKRDGEPYIMDEYVLKEVSKVRDLGVTITSNLKSSDQVSKSIENSSRVLGMIRQAFDFLNEKSFLTLYKTYVRPNLEYCVQAWSPNLLKDMHRMENVQRRATKLVPSLKNDSYEVRLKKLGLTTLQERRERGDMIEVFKILKGIDRVDHTKFFEKNRLKLRGHSEKLSVKFNRTERRKQFFSQRILNKWNNLDEDIISSTSVNIFKKRYDKKHMNA